MYYTYNGLLWKIKNRKKECMKHSVNTYVFYYFKKFYETHESGYLNPNQLEPRTTT